MANSARGLKNPNRPVGCFIGLGPTGVGKTLLARALAKFMFGAKDALVQIDMSEYMEKHDVAASSARRRATSATRKAASSPRRSAGAPTAWCSSTRSRRPTPTCSTYSFQIMEDGRLTDSFGRKVDFRNTILIMTSNIGADVIKSQSGLGFRRSSAEQTYENMKKQLMEEIEKHFRPEFLNRLDDVIVFRALTKEDLRIIVNYEFALVRARAEEKNVDLRLSPEAAEYLIEKGYNPDFGARPLRRVIEHEIEDPLSEDLLKGVFRGAAAVTSASRTAISSSTRSRRPRRKRAKASPLNKARNNDPSAPPRTGAGYGRFCPREPAMRALRNSGCTRPPRRWNVRSSASALS